MKHFLKLNKHKVLFAYKFTAMLFTGMGLILLIIAFIRNEMPSNFVISMIFISTLVVLPLLILLAAYLEWYSNYKRRNKIFSKSPFDKLNEIGFKDVTIKSETKYFFTEEIKFGELNTYSINCDVQKGNAKVLQFYFFIDFQAIENNQISNFCKKHNIEFNYSSFVKNIDTKNLEYNTINGLENELNKFTSLLINNKFSPLKIVQ